MVSNALPVEFTIFELTNVLPAIGKGIGALSVLFVIPVFTDVFIASAIGNSEVSVFFVIPEFTDVFVAIGIGDSHFERLPRVAKRTRTIYQTFGKTLGGVGWILHGVSHSHVSG